MVVGGVGRIILWLIPRLPAGHARRAWCTEFAKGCYEAGWGAPQHIEPCVERVRLGGGAVAGVICWGLGCVPRVGSTIDMRVLVTRVDCGLVTKPGETALREVNRHCISSPELAPVADRV